LRYSEVREVLLQVSGASTLDDETSAQYQTMQWVVEDDLAQVPPSEEFVLIQRYIVALVHFAMNGPNWWDQLNFLSSSSVCDWNSDGGAGCYCADEVTGTVKELSLCKLTQWDVRLPCLVYCRPVQLSRRLLLFLLRPQMKIMSNLEFQAKFSTYQVLKYFIWMETQSRVHFQHS
jgi:hypothetical protein